MDGLTLAGCQGPAQLLSHCPSSTGQGEKTGCKSSFRKYPPAGSTDGREIPASGSVLPFLECVFTGAPPASLKLLSFGLR